MTGILTKIPSLYAFFVQPSPQHLVLLPNTHSGLLVCFLSHRQNRLWPGQMSNELIEDLWALWLPNEDVRAARFRRGSPADATSHGARNEGRELGRKKRRTFKGELWQRPLLSFITSPRFLIQYHIVFIRLTIFLSSCSRLGGAPAARSVAGQYQANALYTVPIAVIFSHNMYLKL